MSGSDQVQPGNRSGPGQVGNSPPRLEARRKVTGRASYVHNVSAPRMLHAKIFRSTVPHGRIITIDVAAALAMPGVHWVLTGADIQQIVPNPYYGPAFHDQPVLALEKVRYVGEPVAVVLADDPYLAADAVDAIVAEYDALDAVYDEVEAVTSPVIVHDVPQTSRYVPRSQTPSRQARYERRS